MSTSGMNPDFRGSFSFSRRLLYVPVSFLTAIVVLFAAFPKLLQDILSSAYMPHLYCYLGSTALAWTQVITDSLIGAAYLAISATLIYLIYRLGSDLAFQGLFLAFGLFIVACGSSHLLEAVTVWIPVYPLSVTIKALTALASIATAAMLPFAVPQIVSLIQSARASERRRLLLETTLMERDAAQQALQQSMTILEDKVRDRTAEITRINEVLAAEINERRKKEEGLRRSEERFSKAFHNSPLPMTISSEGEGRYLDVNEAFLNLLGRNRQSVLGRTTYELGFWVDPQDRMTMVQRLTKEGRIIGLPTKLRILSGEIREATVSAEHIELEGQSCVLAITQDTTETKRLQAQFQRAQKMEAIGRLAGGLAHDFNNILGVIMAYSDLSIEKIGPSHLIAKHLAQINMAASRAVHLTRQLLAFSRQQVVSFQVLDLNAIVDDISKMLRKVVGEDITLLFKPSVPIAAVNADAGQIEQVLMNLVINARDAMPSGGAITIETALAELDDNYVRQHEPVKEGEYVMLSVRDTGCGMDEATKARIFEPFFTTKGPGKGTGLGLASVYGIVKQSGGYIWAYSDVGRGTTFKLYFPRVRADVETLNGPSINAASFEGSETIVLVEDEASLLRVTADALRSAGYTVLEAETPAKAIQMAEIYRDTIDILLTDVIMPDMSGVELSKRLKVIRPSLKVVFMSGFGGEELKRQLSEAPDAVLLEKPFSKRTLLMKIHAVLHP